MSWTIEQPESLTVGNPAGGHVTMDGNGLRLYAQDGVTLLADLDISANPATLTVVGTFQTATAGKRVEINSTGGNVVHFFTGDPNEVLEGQIVGSVSPAAPAGNRQGVLTFNAPRVVTATGPSLDLRSDSADGTIHDGLRLAHSRLGTSVITWDGVTFHNQGGPITAANLPGVDDAAVVAVTVAAGASTGTATFTWPKNQFTAGPIVVAQIVSSSGNAIRATVLLTSVTSSGGTVRVDTNAVLAGSTTFNVHVRGYTA